LEVRNLKENERRAKSKEQTMNNHANEKTINDLDYRVQDWNWRDAIDMTMTA
jgi:hypothetical protein